MIGKMTSRYPKFIALQISNPNKMSLCQWLCHKVPRETFICLGHTPGVAESVPLRTRRIYSSLERGLLPAEREKGCWREKNNSCLWLLSWAFQPGQRASFPSSHGILGKPLLAQLTQNITVTCVHPAPNDCTAHNHRTNAWIKEKNSSWGSKRRYR